MDDNGVRSSIQRLVLGPVTKSLSFWVEVMFMVLIWNDPSTTSNCFLLFSFLS